MFGSPYGAFNIVLSPSAKRGGRLGTIAAWGSRGGAVSVPNHHPWLIQAYGHLPEEQTGVSGSQMPVLASALAAPQLPKRTSEQHLHLVQLSTLNWGKHIGSIYDICIYASYAGRSQLCHTGRCEFRCAGTLNVSRHAIRDVLQDQPRCPCGNLRTALHMPDCR